MNNQKDLDRLEKLYKANLETRRIIVDPNLEAVTREDGTVFKVGDSVRYHDDIIHKASRTGNGAPLESYETTWKTSFFVIEGFDRDINEIALVGFYCDLTCSVETRSVHIDHLQIVTKIERLLYE